jgi:hypothetical protein
LAKPRESALQRIQVGVFGLVLVLVLLSIANMMFRQPAAEENVTQSEEPDLQASQNGEVADEPLAELGVAPTVEAPAKGKPGAPQPNAELDGPNTAPVD